MINKKTLLFLIIMIEGYVVLAIELLAMRTLIPFVGSGTEVVAIIISAVLLPMAIGYNHGDMYFKQKSLNPKRKIIPIRRILLKNLLISLAMFTVGLSFVTQNVFFVMLVNFGVHHHIIQTCIFCGIFLVYPIYLLAQTIPLLSNFFPSEHLSRVTGRILFFSTLGSFGGSVFSTLILMTTIGVHFTLVFTLSLLVFVIILITKRRYVLENTTALGFFILSIWFNSPHKMKSLNIVANTQYSMIRVFSKKMKMDMNDADEQWKIIDVNASTINNAFSSAYSETGKKIPIHDYIEKTLIPTEKDGHKPLNILVIGAAGFALGMKDTYNHYDFVDIEPAMKEVAEKYFLPEPLQKNKEFYPMSARVFLKQNYTMYDLIVLDLFTSVLSIPQEGITQDFLLDVKAHLNKGGIVASNVVARPDYRNKFSVRYYNTFASVFPHPSRQIIGDFKAWTPDFNNINNLFIYFDRPYINDQGIYTDDLNRYSLDK